MEPRAQHGHDQTSRLQDRYPQAPGRPCGISGNATRPSRSLRISILKSRRLIVAMLGSRLHAAFPRTMSLATIRGRNERWTFRSPLMAKLLPVELLTLRAIGSRNQFQSKNATTRMISTVNERKIPPTHFSERCIFISNIRAAYPIEELKLNRRECVRSRGGLTLTLLLSLYFSRLPIALTLIWQPSRPTRRSVRRDG